MKETLYNVYPILKEINEKNNNILDSKLIFRDLYADEYLFAHKEQCPGLLFLLSGSIKVKKIDNDGNETNLYNIEKGDICHEALNCFFKNETLNIIGKALQDSKVCIIPFDIVSKYLFTEKSFFMYIYNDLYNKFKYITEFKENIKHDSLKYRLVKRLLNYKSNIIYVTHSELAFELDSAREVISRNLKVLEKDGWIKLDRGKITVLKDLNTLLIQFKG